MNSRAYRWLLHYGMAIGSTAIALVLTWLLQPSLSQITSPFFFVAITLTTWYGGLQPGIVAIILSTLAINTFFVSPVGNLSNPSISDLIRLATFSSVALMIHWLKSDLQKSQRQVEQLSQQLLDESIDERKQAQLLLQQQYDQQRLVMDMTNRIRQSLNLQEILQTTVDEVRQFLQVDRVIIFQFAPGWSGTIAVESVADKTFALFPFDIHDPCLGDRYVEPFQQGLVTAKADIYAADISPCHVEFLAQFQVRANLVVPILKNGVLWGLLSAHHCVAPRQWQESEIDLLRQIASQVSIALQQAALFEQVQAELVERKQAEAVLQERESLLRLFAQYAPAGIAMFDREMRYVMASQRWVDEYNLSSVESLIGRSHYEVFPDIPERWRHIHQRCLDGAIEKCDDDLFVRSDGEQQWISWEIRPWNTSTGDIRGIVIFSIDVTPRKLAEIELRDRERLFSTLAEALPVVFFRFDQNSHCVYINSYWTALTGRTSESAAGLGWVETLHPQDRDRLTHEWLEWSQNPQQRGLYQNEGRLVHISGKDIWYYIQALPEVDTQGETVGFIGVMTNITDRKQAEESLRQSEARLRLAQVASNSGVWDWDVQQNVLFWSPEYYQLYELDPAIEPNYENWLGCIHPDDRETVNQQTLQALAEASDLRVEFRVMRSHELRWFAGIGQVLRDQAGQPIRLIGITIDITQQKQAEIALQQFNTELEQRVVERTEELNALNNRLLVALKEQYQAKQEVEDLYNNAPCGYHSLNAEGIIVRINNTELSWLGYTRDQVLNQMKFTDLITPESQQTFRQNFPEFIQRGWVNDLEFQLRHKNGSTRWINLNAVALKDDAGNFVMSRSSLFDITERQKIDQMKQEFISVVSHELRTPLTSIRGSLGLIAGGVYDKKPEKMKDMIAIAARQSDRLVRLVNDILNLRHLESGQSKFKFQQCSAADLIQQSVDVMRSQAEQNQVTLTMIPTTAEVWADADAIVQTLTNLLSNAIKFSPPNSIVAITATPHLPTSPPPHSSFTLFSVQDQGRGIPSDHLETIFGQFQQVDASDSREKGGTGLGLAICRTIVKQHSGRIWVESILEQSSTFYFTLPSTQPSSDNG